MSNSLDAPSPPPTVGQPLLDPQQQIYFDQFFESMPSNMIPSVNPAHVFQPELPKEAAVYWPEELQHNYQPTPDQEYIPETSNGYLTSSSAVSTAPAMNTPRIHDVNPFDGRHELMGRGDHPQMNPPGVLSFGSDANFAPNGYQAPAHPNPLDKDGEIHSKIFSALCKNDSNMTTAVNSPVSIKYERTGEDTEDDYSQHQDQTPSPSAGSCTKRPVDDLDDFIPSKSARKARPRPLDVGAAAGMGMKMKKKAMGQKRDNLTEAQKRENHIHSEQKRRNLIRQGFDELCSLVPELKAGGYSKSAVLVHAANYLADLKSGNARLHQYVDQLERGLRYR